MPYSSIVKVSETRIKPFKPRVQGIEVKSEWKFSIKNIVAQRIYCQVKCSVLSIGMTRGGKYCKVYNRFILKKDTVILQHIYELQDQG